MSVTYDTFERYRTKGLDARRAGQWESARVYLLEAARAMALLAREESSERLKEARQETARKLLDLAKDCEARVGEPPPRVARTSTKQATGARAGGGAATDDGQRHQKKARGADT